MVSKLCHFMRESDGQAMVEMAIVLPILLAIVLGTSEFGNAWKQNNSVTSAAREAARVAAVSPPGSGIPVTVAQSLLASAGVKGTPTITVSGINPVTGQITVTVTVPYQPIVGTYILKGVTMTLRGSTTMRWEG